ncbi:MAG: hypothetical protein JWP40_3982, partial [Blastococcus sp.]|nr:hypothetical protein [Blastococcus sp.]
MTTAADDEVFPASPFHETSEAHLRYLTKTLGDADAAVSEAEGQVFVLRVELDKLRQDDCEDGECCVLHHEDAAHELAAAQRALRNLRR